MLEITVYRDSKKVAEKTFDTKCGSDTVNCFPVTSFAIITMDAWKTFGVHPGIIIGIVGIYATTTITGSFIKNGCNVGDFIENEGKYLLIVGAAILIILAIVMVNIPIYI